MSAPDRLWFLFAGYSVIWILLALFLVRLARRHRELAKELGELRARVFEPAAPKRVPGGGPGANPPA